LEKCNPVLFYEKILYKPWEDSQGFFYGKKGGIRG
jgi:hypothetical protein